MSEWEQELLGGRYKIGQLLGEGGMGVVVQGWDVILGREVAIKTIKRDEVFKTIQQNPALFPDDHEKLMRFRREVFLLGSLSNNPHPAIVTVYDASDENEDRPYYVMEYLRGTTLDKYIDSRRGNPFSFEEIIDILEPLADALDTIHSLEPPVVHRDIKPANIMVENIQKHDGKNYCKVKLCDFGISINRDMTQLTEMGGIGTISYMAPELWGSYRDPEDRVKISADNYSLAAVAYSLFTFHFWHDRYTREEWERYDRPSLSIDEKGIVGSYDAAQRSAIAHVLEQALSTNVGDRFGKATEFIQALKMSQVSRVESEGHSGSAYPHSVPTQLGQSHLGQPSSGNREAIGISHGYAHPGHINNIHRAPSNYSLPTQIPQNPPIGETRKGSNNNNSGGRIVNLVLFLILLVLLWLLIYF